MRTPTRFSSSTKTFHEIATGLGLATIVAATAAAAVPADARPPVAGPYVQVRLESPAPAILDGERAGDEFGVWVTGGMDVDLDGAADYAVGAAGHDDGTGKVYVYSGATGALLFAVEGPDGGAFARSLAFVGDADNDGYPDLAVGARLADTPSGEASGRVYLLSGASVLTWPVTGEVIELYRWDGEQPESDFGASVNAAGDWDADGHADVAVGARFYSVAGFGDMDGKAYVFSGRTGERLWAQRAEQERNHFGDSLETAGDVNGDGFSDLLVGAPKYKRLFPEGERECGRAYLFLGGPDDQLQEPRLAWVGDAEGPGHRYGMRVSGLGDVDRDAVPDFLVASRHWADDTSWRRGKVHVYSGATGELLWGFAGEHDGDELGFFADAVADVDGDAIPDLAVAAISFDSPHGADSGRVYVLSGETGAVVSTLDGESPGDQFGYGLWNAGDTRGDARFSFLVVGAPYFDLGAIVDCGRSYVIALQW